MHKHPVSPPNRKQPNCRERRSIVHIIPSSSRPCCLHTIAHTLGGIEVAKPTVLIPILEAFRRLGVKPSLGYAMAARREFATRRRRNRTFAEEASVERLIAALPEFVSSRVTPLEPAPKSRKGMLAVDRARKKAKGHRA
jgi:hypothetical protein